MSPKKAYLLVVVILLIPATCLADRHPQSKKSDKPQPKADPNDIVCRTIIDDTFEYDICANPGDFCGVDKATGELQGCVSASQCPVTTGKTLSCDPGKPSCCCRTTQAEIDANDDVPCNDVWQEDKCKAACTLPDLMNFDFCKIKLSDQVYCAHEIEDDYFDDDYDVCFTNEYCGIQRTTGKLQGCVKASECPSSAKGSKPIVCDPSKPSCCCQEIIPENGDEPDVKCNNIKSWDDTSIREQACKLPELSSLPVCKADPTKVVYCTDGTSNDECSPWQMCGIGKTSGDLKWCLDPTECPKGATGSEKIVCDDSSPFCCCQKLTDANDYENPCNNILDESDNTIWLQACGLPQLSSLTICQNDPSKRISCKQGSSTEKCRPSEMCGIDIANNGATVKCLDPKKCPASAKGSDKIVCDDKSPFCCCQTLEGKNDFWQTPCNYILNDRDNTIWKQTCSLVQLSPLPICKGDPSKHVGCHNGGIVGGVYESTCKSSQFCGVDKTNGRLRGCLDSSQCPANAKGSDNIICDSSAPYCCCQNVDDNYGPTHICNDILNEGNAKKWTQACSLTELSSLPICQDNPTKEVYCTYQSNDNDDQVYSDKCKPSEFCGIDKDDGEMTKCLASSQCPASAKGSKKIVCDGSSPFCCCQNVVDKQSERKHPCNNILNEKDSTIWQQACSLPELEDLDVCQENPTKRVYCRKNYNTGTTNECRPSEFCGIDKANGQLLGCLNARLCPYFTTGSSKIVCDDSEPNCCCQKEVDVGDAKNPCDDILNEKDNTIWQQACGLSQLSGLPICKEDPTKAVYCTFNAAHWKTKQCKPSEYCGIDKSDGAMRNCLEAFRCPNGAKGSEEIVCDDSAPYCCCQKVDAKGDNDHACNNIVGDEEIWKQACSVPELMHLDVCETGKTPEPVDPGETGTKRPFVEGRDLDAGEIVGIVAGVLLGLLFVSGCIYFCCFKKKTDDNDAGEATKVPKESTVAVVKSNPAQAQLPSSLPPPNVPRVIAQAPMPVDCTRFRKATPIQPVNLYSLRPWAGLINDQIPCQCQT